MRSRSIQYVLFVHRTLHFSLTRISFCLLLGILLCSTSCTNKWKNPSFQPEEGIAYFDYFDYQGMDVFYNEHPLEKENQFYNPILPGWYSDPSICRNGDDYYMVTSSFAYFPGVPIFHSRDLVNWKQTGHVLDRISQLPLDGQRITRGIFAPAISYNPHNQTYYMITTNVGRGNFFVKTKDPSASWSEPVWIPEVQGIDPSFFFDDVGKAYIVNNDAPDGTPLYEGHRAIRIHEFDVENDKVTGPGKMIINGGVDITKKPIWIEGPHLYKIKGEYYLMAAEGGTGPQHSEVIFKSEEPLGPYVPWEGNPILTQRHLDPDRENPTTCAGHADLVETGTGDWWAVFLACRPIDNEFENLGRETFLMPVRWSEDGYPYMTKDDEEIPMLLEKDGVVREDVTFGNFTSRDDFNDERLSLYWLSLRAPAKGLYSLEKQDGYFALQASKSKASEKNTPAFVCRRIQHHKFECSIKMIFDSKEGDEAGLLIFKNEVHQYFLCAGVEEGQKMVCLKKISEAGEEVLASSSLENDCITLGLKIVSQGKTFDFYFSQVKDNWKMLEEGVDAGFLSTARAGGFTGTTIGMYAVRK